MKTFVELITDMAGEIEALLKSLVLEHSSISRWYFPNGGVTLIHIGGDYEWNDMDEHGRQLQSKLLENYRKFSALVKTLTREQPQKSLSIIVQSERIIIPVIEQNETTYRESNQEAYDEAVEALHSMKRVIENLYSDGEGVIIVPDTNALLFNPDLEKWRFPKISQFQIILTTTVLSELDKLKVNYRVESVRKKSESLIRRIKGYRARGTLTEGVPLVRGTSEIKALAVEPDLENSLPWLNPDNEDDLILASFVEVMRLNPRCSVISVTRDINLQNKAEFSRLPFCEPPSP